MEKADKGERDSNEKQQMLNAQCVMKPIIEL
jgi:hypothetical protein